MHYLVTGVDGPSFGEPDDLNGLHQDYMDGWADSPDCSRSERVSGRHAAHRECSHH